MSFKLTRQFNPKRLTLLAFVCVLGLFNLGLWQVARMHEKERLLNQFHHRMKEQPLSPPFKQPAVLFHRATMQGLFDNAHQILLDNKTYQGRVGYELYTPFITQGSKEIILVDRGFVPIGKSRQVLPTIEPITEPVTITGLINQPPKYFSWGEMVDATGHHVMRIEYLDLTKIAKLFSRPLYPFVLNLDPHSPFARPLEWQIVVMPPERHRGYAVLWFALAITLLIICLGLNCRRFIGSYRL